MTRLIQGHDYEWVLRDEWGVDDIRSVIETEGIEDAEDLTDEECINIMKIAETAFDANFGLNWNTIASAVNFYMDCKHDGTPMFYRGQPIKVAE